MRVLWVALALSSVFFIVVLQVAERPKTPPNPSMLPMFAAFAVGLIVVSIVLPRRQLQLAGQRAPQGQGPSAPAFMTAFILGMALTDAVAVLGFALGFLNFPAAHYIPFFCVAWLGFFLRFPSERRPIGAFGPEWGEPMQPPPRR